MSASNNWWSTQFVETMKEVSKLYMLSREAEELNFDNLDQAMATYEECCHAYSLTQITFKQFIEFGKSLCSRQALY